MMIFRNTNKERNMYRRITSVLGPWWFCDGISRTGIMVFLCAIIQNHRLPGRLFLRMCRCGSECYISLHRGDAIVHQPL